MLVIVCRCCLLFLLFLLVASVAFVVVVARRCCLLLFCCFCRYSPPGFLGHGQKQFVLLTGVILFSTGLLQQTFVIVACKVLQKLFVIALEFGSNYFCFFFLAFDGRPLYASFPIPRCFFQFRVCVFAGCSVCFDDENLVAVACVCAIIICCRHNHALHVVRVAQLNAILVFLCQVPCEN